ncbi:hypothetical protein PG985_014769 [Apiospora marii]|uniref:uncharacterized protein n=1 Tax=Apiospora marii TaxID=335849 RepID=UPI00312FA9A5
MPTNFNGSVEDITLEEGRIYIILKSQFGRRLPFYSILVLRDGGNTIAAVTDITEGTKDSFDYDPKQEWFGGVVTLLHVIRRAHEVWQEQWHNMLSHLEDAAEFELSDLLDPTRRQKFIYESDYKNSDNSEMCFSLLQILRKARLWVRSTRQPFATLRDDLYKDMRRGLTDFRRSLSAQDQEDLERELQWIQEKFTHEAGIFDAKIDRLVERVTEIANDIQALRDGLLNATQVREAKQASLTNKYVLAFAVVTIIYAPLSYISTLYGMDFFTWEGHEKVTFADFMSITILFSLATCHGTATGSDQDQSQLEGQKTPSSGFFSIISGALGRGLGLSRHEFSAVDQGETGLPLGPIPVISEAASEGNSDQQEGQKKRLKKAV